MIAGLGLLSSLISLLDMDNLLMRPPTRSGLPKGTKRKIDDSTLETDVGECAWVYDTMGDSTFAVINGQS